jgi:hypothetical protein
MKRSAALSGTLVKFCEDIAPSFDPFSLEVDPAWPSRSVASRHEGLAFFTAVQVNLERNPG